MPLPAAISTATAAVTVASTTVVSTPSVTTAVAAVSTSPSTTSAPESSWMAFTHWISSAWSGGLSSAVTNLLISGWIVVLLVEWAIRSREAKREREARIELLVETVMNIRIVLEDVQECPNWLADALVRDYLMLPELRELVLGSRALGLPTETRLRLLSLTKAVDLVDGVYRAQRDLAIRMGTGEDLVDGLWEQMEAAFRQSTAQALVLARDCEQRLTNNPSGPIQATIPLLTCGSCGTQQQVDAAVIQGEAPFQCLYCGAEGMFDDEGQGPEPDAEE